LEPIVWAPAAAGIAGIASIAAITATPAAIHTLAVMIRSLWYSTGAGLVRPRPNSFLRRRRRLRPVIECQIADRHREVVIAAVAGGDVELALAAFVEVGPLKPGFPKKRWNVTQAMYRRVSIAIFR